MAWMTLLFLLMIVGILATELGAYVAKLRISEVAPDYAQRLFRSWSQRIFPRSGPCKFKVLYFEPPPPGLEATVRKLRIVHLASDVSLLAFVGAVLVLTVRDGFS